MSLISLQKKIAKTLANAHKFSVFRNNVALSVLDRIQNDFVLFLQFNLKIFKFLIMFVTLIVFIRITLSKLFVKTEKRMMIVRFDARDLFVKISAEIMEKNIFVLKKALNFLKINVKLIVLLEKKNGLFIDCVIRLAEKNVLKNAKSLIANLNVILKMKKL